MTLIKRPAKESTQSLLFIASKAVTCLFFGGVLLGIGLWEVIRGGGAGVDILMLTSLSILSVFFLGLYIYLIHVLNVLKQRYGDKF